MANLIFAALLASALFTSISYLHRHRLRNIYSNTQYISSRVHSKILKLRILNALKIKGLIDLALSSVCFPIGVHLNRGNSIK